MTNLVCSVSLILVLFTTLVRLNPPLLPISFVSFIIMKHLHFNSALSWNTFVISRLNYYNSLLAGLPLRFIQLLQIIQKAAVWLVFHLLKLSHTTLCYASFTSLTTEHPLTLKHLSYHILHHAAFDPPALLNCFHHLLVYKEDTGIKTLVCSDT